jgi:hypothetical protein
LCSLAQTFDFASSFRPSTLDARPSTFDIGLGLTALSGDGGGPFHLIPVVPEEFVGIMTLDHFL